MFEVLNLSAVLSKLEIGADSTGSLHNESVLTQQYRSLVEKNCDWLIPFEIEAKAQIEVALKTYPAIGTKNAQREGT